MRRRRTDKTAKTGVALLVMAIGACASNLSPGELGTMRYAGRVPGAAPLLLLPPVADPSGNVYVLYGAPTLPQVQAFVGHAAGGWSSSCTITGGDTLGAHGWLGYDTAREWYWSGDDLVAVAGADGTCHSVLSVDPATNVELQFNAVVPWVRNRSLLSTTGASESTTLVAVVQAPTDAVPSIAVVDLNTEILTNLSQWSVPAGSKVQFLGVGGDRDLQLGTVLVQYVKGTSTTMEADFLDGDANVTSKVTIGGTGGDVFGPYAVQGYLQMGSDGLVAGLVATTEGQANTLVVFTSSAGALLKVGTMTPIGVHVWNGQLWVVGTANSQPVIAPITAQGVGSVVPWNASIELSNALAGSITVRDDRSLPSREVSWNPVSTAVGPFPFLSTHALTQQADGTTLWIFAGPSDTAAGTTETAFGMAPVGISYP